MQAPEPADYVTMYFTLFARFEQAQQKTHQGRPFKYEQKQMIVFYTMMMLRRIQTFKAQHRWLETHPVERQSLAFSHIPHRTTLSRRYKTMETVVQSFIEYLGRWAEPLSPDFSSDVLVEDSSLFKANGPVWHQSDRRQQRIPAGLRHLDTDAAWGKSGYHGWVYGYGLHLTTNLQGFPKLAIVEPANVADAVILERKKEQLWQYNPLAIVGDNGYFQAKRTRAWAKEGILLLTPAKVWQKGRYARAFHKLRKRLRPNAWLKARKTAIEPIFDLFCKVLGIQDNHKQLPLQGLPNVTTLLLLSVLAVQISMLANNIWNLPFRQVSHMISVFS